MIQVNDIKTVYPEFKSFKDIYTRLKVSETVYFRGNKLLYSDSVILGFGSDSPFYRLYGKWENSTKFGEWLRNGKTVSTSIDNINSIAKCLKKNAASIEYDDKKFAFCFNDKDGNPQVVELEDTFREILFESPFKNIEFIEKILESSLFEDDLIRIYRYGDELTLEKTDDLLLEVPRTSVLSFQPKSENIVIRFTKNPEKCRKYVEIESTYEGLTLTQLFATI